MPSASKAGPRLAIVAGTRTVTTSTSWKQHTPPIPGGVRSLSYLSELVRRSWHLAVQVAGGHRARPSPTLDKSTYAIVHLYNMRSPRRQGQCVDTPGGRPRSGTARSTVEGCSASLNDQRLERCACP